MSLLPYNFILRLIGLNVDIFNKSIASSKWIPVLRELQADSGE
jgi:hypothetical protein